MRTKRSARRGRVRGRPGTTPRSIPSASPSPTPNHTQAEASSCPEDEALLVPDTYGDSQGKEQSRDEGLDVGAEKVVPPVTSEERCPPDESADDQMLDKSSCLKCGEGGELLVCSENSCPISIHEKCLNCEPRFDESGSFYCPYCTYKRMAIKVQKLRRKAMLAEKKLTNFLDPGKDEQGEKKLEGERPEASGSGVCPCSRNGSKDDNNKKVDNGGMFQRSEPVNQLYEKSTSSDYLSAGHERKKQKSKTVAGPTDASPRRGDSSRGLNDEGSGRNQRPEGTAGLPVIVPQIMPLPLRALSSWKLVKRDSLADQSNFQLHHPNNLTEMTIPNVKRKRLYWRPEEEEMLKEAVRSFQSNINKNLPWRKILEYGRLVFDETRTPSDLKDKWKTMTRSRR